MIKTVIRLKNNMVMVFDEEGEQVPELQGYYEDVRESILTHASGGTAFNHWFDISPEPEVVLPRAW